MTIILVFAAANCQHMHLSRKGSASHLRGVRGDIGRKEAVFAVCLPSDTDINEVMQRGAIIKTSMLQRIR